MFMLILKYSTVVPLHNGGNKLNLINIITVLIWHKMLTKNTVYLCISYSSKVFKLQWFLNLNVVTKQKYILSQNYCFYKL